MSRNELDTREHWAEFVNVIAQSCAALIHPVILSYEPHFTLSPSPPQIPSRPQTCRARCPDRDDDQLDHTQLRKRTRARVEEWLLDSHPTTPLSCSPSSPRAVGLHDQRLYAPLVDTHPLQSNGSPSTVATAGSNPPPMPQQSPPRRTAPVPPPSERPSSTRPPFRPHTAPSRPTAPSPYGPSATVGNQRKHFQFNVNRNNNQQRPHRPGTPPFSAPIVTLSDLKLSRTQRVPLNPKPQNYKGVRDVWTNTTPESSFSLVIPHSTVDNTDDGTKAKPISPKHANPIHLKEIHTVTAQETAKRIQIGAAERFGRDSLWVQQMEIHEEVARLLVQEEKSTWHSIAIPDSIAQEEVLKRLELQVAHEYGRMNLCEFMIGVARENIAKIEYYESRELWANYYMGKMLIQETDSRNALMDIQYISIQSIHAQALWGAQCTQQYTINAALLLQQQAVIRRFIMEDEDQAFRNIYSLRHVHREAVHRVQLLRVASELESAVHHEEMKRRIMEHEEDKEASDLLHQHQQLLSSIIHRCLTKLLNREEQKRVGIHAEFSFFIHQLGSAFQQQTYSLLSRELNINERDERMTLHTEEVIYREQMERNLVTSSEVCEWRENSIKYSQLDKQLMLLNQYEAEGRCGIALTQLLQTQVMFSDELQWLQQQCYHVSDCNYHEIQQRINIICEELVSGATLGEDSHRALIKHSQMIHWARIQSEFSLFLAVLLAEPAHTPSDTTSTCSGVGSIGSSNAAWLSNIGELDWDTLSTKSKKQKKMILKQHRERQHEMIQKRTAQLASSSQVSAELDKYFRECEHQRRAAVAQRKKEKMDQMVAKHKQEMEAAAEQEAQAAEAEEEKMAQQVVFQRKANVTQIEPKKPSAEPTRPGELEESDDDG